MASLFVGKPFNIFAVAAVCFIGFVALRASAFGASRQPRWLLVAAIVWFLYAAWEWLVQARTPEANLRVGLLVIWPVFGTLSAWALFRAFR